MNLKEEVFVFCNQTIGIDVRENTLLFAPSGIDGLDAEGFMYQFSERFKVDISTFNHLLYYTGEGDLINPFSSLFGTRKDMMQFTFDVGHLIHVAEKGKWFGFIGF